MKSLQAFWHWVDNEKPDTARFNEAADEHLSSNACSALEFALVSVDARAGCTYTSHDRAPVMGAIRDLSLAVCRALDEMCDRVEEDCLAVAVDVHDGCMDCGSDVGHYLGCVNGPALDDCTRLTPGDKGTVPAAAPMNTDGLHPICRREYLGDWIPAQRPAWGTFSGVDRTPPEKLTGKRITQADLDKYKELCRRSWLGIGMGIDVASDAPAGLREMAERVELFRSMAVFKLP
jgi:hypothetical protein